MHSCSGAWRGNQGKHGVDIILILLDANHGQLQLNPVYFRQSKQRSGRESAVMGSRVETDKRVWSPQCGTVCAEPDGAMSPCWRLCIKASEIKYQVETFPVVAACCRDRQRGIGCKPDVELLVRAKWSSSCQECRG
jgi:hypothetical protein